MRKLEFETAQALAEARLEIRSKEMSAQFELREQEAAAREALRDQEAAAREALLQQKETAMREQAALQAARSFFFVCGRFSLLCGSCLS